MLNGWMNPSELAAANFSARNVEIDDTPKPIIEVENAPRIEKMPENNEQFFNEIPPIEEQKSDENKSKSGLDLGSLLGVLGGLNGGQDTSGLGSILGLIRGEKPDMMALMPLLASMLAKKPEKTEQKVQNDDEKNVNENTKIDLANYVVE